jgi:hypothetical protein
VSRLAESRYQSLATKEPYVLKPPSPGILLMGQGKYRNRHNNWRTWNMSESHFQYLIISRSRPLSGNDSGNGLLEDHTHLLLFRHICVMEWAHPLRFCTHVVEVVFVFTMPPFNFYVIQAVLQVLYERRGTFSVHRHSRTAGSLCTRLQHWQPT